MKRTVALGITALTIAAACGPLTAQAAGKTGSLTRKTVKVTSQSTKKQSGKNNSFCQDKTDARNQKNFLQNCTLDELKEQLESAGWKGVKLKWGTVIWNGNCPILPDNGGNGDNNNGGDEDNGNGGSTEKPDETPDNGGNNNGNNGSGGNGNGSEDTDQETEASFARQVVALVNAERAKEGLKALTIDKTIEKAALVRAKEIQSNFSHTRPNGTSFTTALKEAGVSYRMSGENIAWGQKTPEAVVTAWMNSPSHRANIMKKSFTKIGVGHLQKSNGVSYWVQLFTN